MRLSEMPIDQLDVKLHRYATRLLASDRKVARLKAELYAAQLENNGLRGRVRAFRKALDVARW